MGIHEVYTACDGEDALKLMRSSHIDILLCDVKMPHMNGIDLAYHVRAANPECKIVFLSGYSDKEYLKSAISLKAESYIEKPINLAEITKVMSDVVSQLKHENTEKQKDVLLMVLEKEQYHDIENIKQHLNDTKISNAIRFILRNYSNSELSVKMVADYVDLSQNYLSTLFKKNTQSTINDFIIQVRIEKAKQLLKTTDLRLYEIAEKVGLTDPNYMSALFKRCCGQTPMQYRQMSS